jgi:hypothetical protein
MRRYDEQEVTEKNKKGKERMETCEHEKLFFIGTSATLLNTVVIEGYLAQDSRMWHWTLQLLSDHAYCKQARL